MTQGKGVNEIVTLSDGTSVRLKDAVDEMIREVITALFNKSNGPTKNAMLSLMTHMSANWRTLFILDEHAEDKEKNLLSHSMAILTRSMFDAYIQLAFIAQEDTEERAKLYLKYEAIERYQNVAKTVKRDDDISRYVAKSPLRAEGEKKLKASYDEVVGYYTNGKGRVRDHWYPKNLSQIAEDVGKSDEYFWYTQRFNSSVHAGPLAVREGHPADDFLSHAVALMSRVAKLVTEHNGLVIGAGAQSTIDALAGQSLTSTN